MQLRAPTAHQEVIGGSGVMGFDNGHVTTTSNANERLLQLHVREYFANSGGHNSLFLGRCAIVVRISSRQFFFFLQHVRFFTPPTSRTPFSGTPLFRSNTATPSTLASPYSLRHTAMAAKTLSSIAFAPVVAPTLEDMEEITRIIEANSEVLKKYGAIRIDPPHNWQPPILRINDNSTFFVREQKMPWKLITTSKKKKSEISEFEESATKISLRDYRAHALKKDVQLEPNQDTNPSDNSQPTSPDANILESKFWQILQNGQDGQTVDLIYGIDIENNSTLHGGTIFPVTSDNNKEGFLKPEAVDNAAGGATKNGKIGNMPVLQEEIIEAGNGNETPLIEEEVLESGNGNEEDAKIYEECFIVDQSESIANHDLAVAPGGEYHCAEETIVEIETRDAAHEQGKQEKDAISVQQLVNAAAPSSETDDSDHEKLESIETRLHKPNKIDSNLPLRPNFAKVESAQEDAFDSARTVSVNEHAQDSGSLNKSQALKEAGADKEDGIDMEQNRKDALDRPKEVETQGNRAGETCTENNLQTREAGEAPQSEKREAEDAFDSENALLHPPKKRKKSQLQQESNYENLEGEPSRHSSLSLVKGERNCPKFDPTSHIGNINKRGVLRHLPVMPGINQPMFYIGHRYTRFCWHVEDAFLNSLAYLHDGSATKVWYCIPPDQALQFEKYAAEMFGPAIRDGKTTAASLLRFKTAMFHPVKLMERGITVHRVFQKPRSFVVTAARSYHSGFNCGFNISEAVNYGSPLWFPSGREAAEELRSISKQLFVPHELLLYHEVQALQKQIDKIGVENITADQTLVQHAVVIADELWKYMRQGETAIQKYAQRSRSRVFLWRDVEQVASTHQLGPEYGANAGILCDICQYTCHFYVAMCSICTGNERARCHRHFGRVCNKRGHKMIVVRRHEPVSLLRLLEASEKIAGKPVSSDEHLDRLRLICSPDAPSRSYRMRLRGYAKENDA